MKHFWLGFLFIAATYSCSVPTKQQSNSTVRIRWTRDPENLFPLALPNQNAIDAADLLYCGLLQLNFSTGTHYPALADSLPQVHLLGDSLMRLRYRLRAAAMWDDGSPVLATDVAFTLKLFQCPGLPNETARAQYGFIQAIELDPADPRVFTLVCRGQVAAYSIISGDFAVLPESALDPQHTLRQFSLAALARYPAAATPDKVLQQLAERYQQADLGHHPERLPGCGAYRLAEWQAGRSLTFVRKPHWWADALRPTPFVLQARSPRLQFLIIPDDATAVLALRRHELDVLPQLSAREFKRLQASSAARQELSFYSTTSYEVVTAGFNTSRPILHDSLTRQALSRLFDPARLLQATQLGQGMRTVGLVHPTDHHYYYDSLPLPSFDPGQTRVLLQRAGWHYQQSSGWTRQGSAKQPEHLALVLRYRVGETTFETTALQFKAAAAALAIPVEIRPTEASSLTNTLREGDFDIYVRMLKGTPFAFNYAPILHSKTINEGNFSKFSNAAFDQLIDAIAVTGSNNKRQLLLRRFQLLLQQQMPLVPLFFLPYRLATAQNIEHLYPSGLKPGYDASAITWAITTGAATAGQ